MADFRDLEARGVPEHLWPDDAFQQKYTREHMMALTEPRKVKQTISQEKAKKGVKVPVRLEFEQRFLLDTRKSDDILNELCEPRRPIALPFAEFNTPKPGIQVCQIRQFYDEGDRFRHTGETWGHRSYVAPASFVKEKKKSLYLGTTYSANSEEEDSITVDEFETGWKKAERRLQKIRFQVPSVIEEHRTVVDFFYTMRDSSTHVYAVTAEDEALLDNTVTTLLLQFELPIYLQRYCLSAVDSSNPDMKLFRSANMIDTPQAIEAFERAISQWYEPL